MRSLFRGTTVLDWVQFFFLLAAAVASIGVAGAAAGAGEDALVESGGEIVARLPLDREESVTVRGAVGSVVVTVREGRVAVTRADCPNHVCVRTGWKEHSGDVVVCAPNRIVVVIVGRTGVRPEGVTG
jgi:hypothetical protein